MKIGLIWNAPSDEETRDYSEEKSESSASFITVANHIESVQAQGVILSIMVSWGSMLKRHSLSRREGYNLVNLIVS